MMKISTAGIKKTQILYVLEIKLEGKVLVKIGITDRRIEDRVCEILVGIWKKYRVFPECYVKRYRSVEGYREYERILHEYFGDRRYETEHKFGGSTEVFEVELDEVVVVYDRLVETGDVEDRLAGDKGREGCEGEAGVCGG